MPPLTRVMMQQQATSSSSPLLPLSSPLPLPSFHPMPPSALSPPLPSRPPSSPPPSSPPLPSRPALNSSIKQQIEYYLSIINLYAPLIAPYRPQPSTAAQQTAAVAALPSPSSTSSLLLSDSELMQLSALLHPSPASSSPPPAASAAVQAAQPLSTSVAFIQSLPELPEHRRSRVQGEECAICQELLVPAATLAHQPAASPTAASPPLAQSPATELCALSPSRSPSPCPLSSLSCCSGGRVLQLPCDHLFHESCVVRWLLRHNSCPCCRRLLPTDDAAYNLAVVCTQPPPLKRKFSADNRYALQPPQPSPQPQRRRGSKRRRLASASASACALSAEGVDCVLLPEGVGAIPGAGVMERLRCGHCFHRQCLVTAGQLMGCDTKVKRVALSAVEPRAAEEQSSSTRAALVFCPLCRTMTAHAD